MRKEIHRFVYKLAKQHNLFHFANFKAVENDFGECRHKNNIRKRKKYCKRRLRECTKNRHRIYYLRDKTYYLLASYIIQYVPSEAIAKEFREMGQ
jgi:hypothetical protein